MPFASQRAAKWICLRHRIFYNAGETVLDCDGEVVAAAGDAVWLKLTCKAAQHNRHDNTRHLGIPQFCLGV